MSVFESAGKGHLGKELAQRSQKEVKDFGGARVQKRKKVTFVARLNSCQAQRVNRPTIHKSYSMRHWLHLRIENLGWDQSTGALAKQLIESAARLDPMNNRLKAIRGLYEELQKRFGIDAVRAKLG